MSDPVITVENLKKRYVIGHQRSKHDGFRHAAEAMIRAPFRWMRDRRAEKKLESEEFWALSDVSFEVQKGDVVGIIGRNGAGKSTLLKILSRITEPTSGRIVIDGRVASLLEVGTGFHQELTGRENIYLNGAILGMSRVEIKRKFDEIVAFSEVERFLDTPVKRYSSGMYVRLAFAVAAHLEPEILIVDEVLAVGDSGFQQKCLGKMKDVAGHGRTVLFVSHNLGAVRSLCNKGILLKNGRLAMSGLIDEVTAAYIDTAPKPASGPTVFISKRPDHCSVWMSSLAVLRNGEPSHAVEMGDKIALAIKFNSSEPIQKPIIGYVIKSARSENIINANNLFLSSSGYSTPVTEGTIVCDLGDLPLMAGAYSVSFWLGRNRHELHHLDEALHFTVEEKDIWGNGVMPTKSLSSLWWPTRFSFNQ